MPVEMPAMSRRRYLALGLMIVLFAVAAAVVPDLVYRDLAPVVGPDPFL